MTKPSVVPRTKLELRQLSRPWSISPRRLGWSSHVPGPLTPRNRWGDAAPGLGCFMKRWVFMGNDVNIWKWNLEILWNTFWDFKWNYHRGGCNHQKMLLCVEGTWGLGIFMEYSWNIHGIWMEYWGFTIRKLNSCVWNIEAFSSMMYLW